MSELTAIEARQRIDERVTRAAEDRRARAFADHPRTHVTGPRRRQLAGSLRRLADALDG